MSETNDSMDAKVLAHLESCAGSTAWAMRGAVSADRKTVSRSLYRLKRRGVVWCEGFYWRAVVCETCQGSGKIDQTLGGEWNSGVVPCPDCDGRGR